MRPASSRPGGSDRITLSDFSTGVRAGNARAIARAATAIENRAAGAAALLRELFPHTGRASTIGITGPPGAGKSTLTSALTAALRREGCKVGVIAVDPTSPFTGGAIMGDRIRMLEHDGDPGVFIRSMATRGRLGGIAAATSDLALLLDAAGFDTIIVETVGVGQDEVEIARLADVTAVVLIPGMGDDVQAIKAGIMEIADVYLLNKADLPGADKLERELQLLLTLAPRTDGWTPPIVRCTATQKAGIGEALAAIRAFQASGLVRARERANWQARLVELFRERAILRLSASELAQAASDVAARRRDPYSVVEQWMQQGG